jgi:hypothetical protein
MNQDLCRDFPFWPWFRGAAAINIWAMKKKRKYTKHTVFIWFAALVLLVLQLAIQGPPGQVRVQALARVKALTKKRDSAKYVAESDFMQSGLCMPSRSNSR